MSKQGKKKSNDRSPASVKKTSTVRKPSLVAPPRKTDALIRLVNLLPKCLRRDNKNHKTTPELMFGKTHIIEFWDWKTDQDAVGYMWYFDVLLDALPLPLQAFILHDDDGRYLETSTSPAPLFVPDHLQPYENINLIAASDDELKQTLDKVKNRLKIETDLVESKKTDRKDFVFRADYEVGETKFAESGLYYLVRRARQRLLFVLAAEEVLDALARPNAQEHLNRARYLDESGATRGYLYVREGKVKLGPPTLFWFVVDVDASRIRKCKVCEDYFWAGRKDKRFCSSRCDARNRKRNERNRYYETGKWQRYLKEQKNSKPPSIELGEQMV